jgi:serine/threonine protein kinase
MLLDARTADATPADFLRSQGEIFAVFDARTQDSGNVSYGLRVGQQRFFVKTAGDPDDPKPALPHPERVAQLRTAVRIAEAAANHPGVPAFRHIIESAQGPLLVYDWVEGELISTPRERRTDPASPYARFRALPAEEILAALDTVFDLHARLAARGWVAVDFYDGSLIYDFSARNIRVVDMDMYRDAPFVNEMGRMFGSDRFMAPEEFERGARIDERTNVFTMGRTLLEFLGDSTDNPATFRGPGGLLEVARHACQPAPAARFATLSDFLQAVRSVPP